ncbi:MAG: T9SS type A sorting domain-containing protein [Bacteroidetes bacterium]|nr:T9SS type A sorting domain-containing protein [Bacteroidota bacterium]
MNVANYTGNSVIRANGGNSANGGTIGGCYGGGGDGSGGAVYFTGAVRAITVSVNGGAAGVESGRDGTCAAEQAAGAGSNGQIFSVYSFRRSFDPAGYCLLLLPSKLLYFKAQLMNQSVLLNWQVDHPELVKQFTVEKKTGNDWVVIAVVDPADGRFKYSATDLYPATGHNFYRLKVTERSGSSDYSETRMVWMGNRSEDFFIYPNPASGNVFVTGKLVRGEMLQLINLYGSILWQQKIQAENQTIGLPPLPPGVYLVRYKKTVKKLIVR